MPDTKKMHNRQMDLQKEQNKADKPYMFSEDKIFVKLGA
jgi:hypothetical protein